MTEDEAWLAGFEAGMTAGIVEAKIMITDAGLRLRPDSYARAEAACDEQARRRAVLEAREGSRQGA
jgi:hypothetical protein